MKRLLRLKSLKANLNQIKKSPSAKRGFFYNCSRELETNFASCVKFQLLENVSSIFNRALVIWAPEIKKPIPLRIFNNSFEKICLMWARGEVSFIPPIMQNNGFYKFSKVVGIFYQSKFARYFINCDVKLCLKEHVEPKGRVFSFLLKGHSGVVAKCKNRLAWLNVLLVHSDSVRCIWEYSMIEKLPSAQHAQRTQTLFQFYNE